MRNTLKFLCSSVLVLLLSALPHSSAYAQSPEFLQLMGEVKTAIKHSSANVTRGEICAPHMFDMAKEGIQANEFNEMLNRVVVAPLETGAKIAAGSLGVPGGVVTSYSLVRCYMKEADWEGLKRCAIGEAIGYAGGMGLEKIDIDGLEGALAGAAWDKAYDALRDAVESYQQTSETINWTAGGKCQITVTAVWNKRRMPGAEGGMISVQINANDCRCNAPGDLERGNMRFRLPVKYVRTGASQPGWATDTSGETTLRVQCCGSRRESPNTRYRLDGGFAEFVRDHEAPPPKSPEPPPPPKAAPPVPAEPQWSDSNPCPECQPFLDLAEKHRQAAEELKAEAEEIQTRLQANRQRQRASQQRMDQLNREISGKAGEGGSAFDPDSGLTTESWTQADGSVKITVRDARGNILSERTRQRRDVSKLREQAAKEEAELARLKAEEAKLNTDLDRVARGRQTQLKLEADARAELHRCVEEKCKKQTDLQQPQTACILPAAQPITIGPREKFGYGAEQRAAATGKAALGLLGGFLGGRGGGGPIQTGPSGGDKPQLADDPIRDKQKFTDPQTNTTIKVGSQYRPDGRLLVSVDVDKAEDKGVVHQVIMERLQYLPSGGCVTQMAEPIEWLHYEIWEDWWAKIRIQRYESVDGGPWRKTHDTGWLDSGSGSRLLDSGTMTADQIPHTAWGSMGADRAFGGPRSAGALFNPGKPLVTGQPAPERLVVHVTQPGKDPVATVPFTLYPTYGMDGKVSYSDKAPDWNALRQLRMPKGGGMERIDPPSTGTPPQESILDSIDSGTGKTPLAK